jgi:hypothetical protein
LPAGERWWSDQKHETVNRQSPRPDQPLFFDVYVFPHTGRVLVGLLEGQDEVSVLDVVAGSRLFRKRVAERRSVRFIDVSGRPLVVVRASDSWQLLDAESGHRVRRPLQLGWADLQAAGRVDGVDILATQDLGGLVLTDLASGKPTIPTIKMPSRAARLAFGGVGQLDVIVTAHFATVRVWNPRTGRKITELPFGTGITDMSVRKTDGGLLVAVSGPGIVLTELRELPT